MAVRKIIENIYSVGSIDWDRKMFDELIPLPDGTSYNSYLIKGSEKIALIDGVDPTKEKELLENLKQAGVDRLDYIVSQHAEQDHSGSIPALLSRFPSSKVVTNEKCKNLLMEFLLIPEDRIIVIKDKESLSLGDKTLQFMLSPWVHWPDTMFTYIKEDNILFSTDFLGSHNATSHMFANDKGKIYIGAKRYFSEIMIPFRNSARLYLENIKKLNIKMICPSHGPIYDEPKFILDAYDDWASEDVKNKVVLPYVSMHGSVQKMADHFVEALIMNGVEVEPFNLPKTDIGELAMSLVDAATIVIGASAVLVGPHPTVVHAAYLANALRPKAKFASIIGSYGWGSKLEEGIKDRKSVV